MLPVEGKPLLEHVLDHLAEAGIRECALITGYHREMIERHFAAYPMRLEFSKAKQGVDDSEKNKNPPPRKASMLSTPTTPRSSTRSTIYANIIADEPNKKASTCIARQNRRFSLQLG